jgi:hypothetical protein
MFAVVTGYELFVLHQGSKEIKKYISGMREHSPELTSQDRIALTRYLDAADRFLVKSAKFIDILVSSNKLLFFNLFVGFVTKYPKTKQNLANPDELIMSLLNFYVTTSKKNKKYKVDKDPNLKFIRDNSSNIYDALVLITNLDRSRGILYRHFNTHK